MVGRISFTEAWIIQKVEIYQKLLIENYFPKKVYRRSLILFRFGIMEISLA